MLISIALLLVVNGWGRTFVFSLLDQTVNDFCLNSFFLLTKADRGMHVDRVLQMSKAIVLSLASVESAAMTDSLGNLKLASATTGSAGDNLIKSSLAALRKVMAKEMQMYCDAFELGMATASPPGRLIDISITSPSVRVSDLAQDINLSINIISAHRLRSK